MKFFNIILVLSIFSFTSCSNSDDSLPGTPIDNSGDVRYNSFVFNTVDITTNAIYGNNTTQNGVNQDLLMDIYQPSGDTESMRNLVILAHGGGFVSGDKDSFSELANYLARSGYVVASINYRLLDLSITPERITQAVIEATFDMKAAVRYFKQDAATINTYRINPNTIFIGGYSAGGFMSLSYGYVNNDSEITEIGGTNLLNYVNNNGGHSGNSGNAGYSDNVRGVINIAGALINAAHVNAGEPRLFSIHGTDDQVVPFNSGESNNTGVITEGSGLIHPVATSVGIINSLKAISGGDHGAFSSCDECPSELRSFIFQNL